PAGTMFSSSNAAGTAAPAPPLGTLASGGNGAQGSLPLAGAGASTMVPFGAGASGTSATPTMIMMPMTAGSAGAGANDPNTVSVQMDEFTVPPGGEVFMCQDFDNPFGGVDVAVGRSESIMTKGSHHLHVFYGAGMPLKRMAAECENPNEFRPMIHLA